VKERGPSRPSRGRLLFLFVGGLSLGAAWLIALEPILFAEPLVPTDVVIVKVDERPMSVARPPFTGRAADGAEFRFWCQWGGKVGETKTISVSKGLLTGRRFVGGQCGLHLING